MYFFLAELSHDIITCTILTISHVCSENIQLLWLSTLYVHRSYMCSEDDIMT